MPQNVESEDFGLTRSDQLSVEVSGDNGHDGSEEPLVDSLYAYGQLDDGGQQKQLVNGAGAGKVKVGKRTFQVSEIGNNRPHPKIVNERMQKTRAFDNYHSPQTHTGTAVEYSGNELALKSANHVGRARRRRRRANSIGSLPASTISAFSAFSRPANELPPPKRTKAEMILNSSIMFGREFCYAVEAGLTTPILLSIGLPSNMYSLVWVISPILGFILQPVIGSVSDRCRCRWGRRRPFILGLTLLLLIGVTLFLNGEHIVSYFDAGNIRRGQDTRSFVIAAIAITITGVVIFDFSADFIEGPIRAYAMDVCNEEDVKVCLLYQAIFTGVGGAFGYASGGVSWTNDTMLGRFFPTDRQVVYAASAVVFVICCIMNILSIPEKPLKPKEAKSSKPTRRAILPSASSNSSGDRRIQKVDVNRNYNSVGNGNPEDDVEGAVLHSLMKSKRNKLFEEYETMATGSQAKTRKPDSGAPRSGKSRGRRVSVSKKHSAKVHSRSGKRRTSSSRKKSKSKTGSSLAYGTFPAYEAYPVFDPTVQPSAPPHPDYMAGYQFQQPLGGVSKHASDVLAARRVFPSIEYEEFNNDDDVSTSTGSDYSMDEMMNHNKISPYAEADPGKIPLSLPNRGQEDGWRGIVAKKKIFPDYKTTTEDEESLLDSEHFQKRLERRKRRDGSSGSEEEKSAEVGGIGSLIRSIRTMPKELKYLCVCHFFGWIAFLCMALFFTDFVGQVVMQGDPRAPRNSRQAELYKRGVEIGNWGLTINAAASAIYCAALKPLIRRFGSRAMYVFGYLAFGVGSGVVALFPNIYVVLCLSSAIGVMSATLYTLPYLLVAQYHETYKDLVGTSDERGIGTDCALVTCMIQLAQIVTGLGIGTLVTLLDTVTVTVATAAIVAFIGTIWAAVFVKY